MSWRILQITKKCSLSIKRSQLLYKTEEDELTLPLEDISVIVLESHQITISNYLLSECAAKNIVVFSCDETHMPAGVFLPFQNHSRLSEHAFLQISMKVPLKKRLWQKIITTKILNQASVLSLVNKEAARDLRYMADNVQSGDVTNIEATAAGLYWKYLFKNFKRGANCINNACLNYGYAILRGAIAREIAATGLLPCLGLHHCNKLNAFNLADDIIEPFRPFIDRIVLSMHYDCTQKNCIESLKTEQKQRLISVLTEITTYDNQSMVLLNVIEKCVKSLLDAIKTKEADAINLPILLV